MAYIDLTELPARLRADERTARESATDDSGYEIVYRSGFHGRPASDPPAVGVVETIEAAEWFTRKLVETAPHQRMRPYAYRPYSEYGAGTFPADAPTSPEAEGFARAIEDIERQRRDAAESFATRQPYVHWR